MAGIFFFKGKSLEGEVPASKDKIEQELDLVLKSDENCDIRFFAKIYCLIEI